MPDGTSHITPPLEPRATTASSSYINAATGLALSRQEICTLLTRMSLSATPSPSSEDLLDVLVPCTRPDILHECDIMEDAAIAYGFNELPRALPTTNTVAQAFPVNRLGDIIRKECAMAGWIEALPLILVSFRTIDRIALPMLCSALTTKTSPGSTVLILVTTLSTLPTQSPSSTRSSVLPSCPVCLKPLVKTRLCLCP